MFESIKNFFKRDSYSLKEYLSKDENGITLLERFIREGKILTLSEEKKFSTSVEACYIYVIYNRSLINFTLTDEQLFSIVNGYPLIEFILDCYPSDIGFIIGQIKNNVEIVDLIIKKGYFNLFVYLSDELKEQLLIENINDEVFIEKYFDDQFVIGELFNVFNNPVKLIDLCRKKNRIDLLRYCNAESLMYNVNEKETLLDYLSEKNIIPEILYRISYSEQKFIKFLVSKELFNYFRFVNDNRVFLIEIEKGLTLFEILIDKGLLTELNICINEPKVIELLYKKNKLHLEKIINIDLLLEDCKVFNIDYNGNLMQYFLDNKYSFTFTFNEFINNVEEDQKIKRIIRYLYNNGQYSIIGRSLKGKNLLLEVEDGVCLLDVLLEKNVYIDFGIKNITSKEILDKLFEKNRIDLFVKVDLQLLLSIINEKTTYLDYLLLAIKDKKINLNIINFNLENLPINVVASFYLSIAKHNVIELLEQIGAEDLLKEYNGVILLDKLLDLDKELTLKRLLNNKILSNFKISVFLKKRGININFVNIPLKDKDFSGEHLFENNFRYGIGPLREKGEFLLNKLRELFLIDGESDKDLIECLINGYKQALINNYDIFIIELQNLIDIKENNINFKYLKHESKCFFNRSIGAVYCSVPNLNILMHETGHALHWYMAKGNFPENLDKVLDVVRQNPEVLRKTEKFCKDFMIIKNSKTKLEEEKSKTYFESYYTIEKNNEIIEFLSKTKEEKKKELMNLGIASDDLDVILDGYFTIEEYKKTQKRLFIKQSVDFVLRNEYNSMISISDIIDAVYCGQLASNVLLNEQNELIKAVSGHGVSYYLNNDIIFREIIANFSSILKSNDASEKLALLKDIIGYELFDLISDYYYYNIIYKQENKTISLK